jgi:sarcosine oxidase
VKVGDHGTGPVVDPDHRTFEPDPEAWARLLDAFAHWFPGLEVATAESSTCLYATTPTDDFVLDRRGPVVVAAGFGGHGFKFGPAIGRIVADLVDGVAAPERFSLDRPSVTASPRLR